MRIYLAKNVVVPFNTPVQQLNVGGQNLTNEIIDRASEGDKEGTILSCNVLGSLSCNAKLPISGGDMSPLSPPDPRSMNEIIYGRTVNIPVTLCAEDLHHSDHVDELLKKLGGYYAERSETFKRSSMFSSTGNGALRFIGVPLQDTESFGVLRNSATLSRKNVTENWQLSIELGVSKPTSLNHYSPTRNSTRSTGFLRVSDPHSGLPTILDGLSRIYKKQEMKLVVEAHIVQGSQLQGWGEERDGEITSISINEPLTFISSVNAYGVEKCGVDIKGNHRNMREVYEADITIMVVVPDYNIEVDPFVTDKLCMMKKLLQEEICTDVTIIAKNEAAVKCHKSFLAVHSVVLETMFRTSMTESQTSIVKIPDMGEASVRAFLAYLYYWETKEAAKNSLICFELLAAGHKYDISKLETCMKNIMLKKDVKWFDVDVAMKLFLFSRNLPNGNKLKIKAIQILKSKFAELKNSPSYRQLFKDDPEAAMDLCKYAFSV